MRYRFVNDIVALDPGKNIHCRYSWREELSIFNDHFPEFHVVPGVLLIEMMGQAVALCVESKHAEYGTPMLIQVKNAMFRNWVRPAELLDIYGEVLSVQPKLTKVKVRVERATTPIATVDLLFSFASRERLGLPPVDPILKAYLDRNPKAVSNNHESEQHG